tara:strand:- start:2255 stop:3745 length:1491 start_codon:yes stop_codon:yes gene_type:complete
MKSIYTIILLTITFVGSAQMEQPIGDIVQSSPTWDQEVTKSLGDSCGTYFNNYIGISKTPLLREEPLRTGNASEAGQYNGRAQRFSAPQTIEVSGVEFYAYIKNNPTQDSLMVITSLNEYDVATDSVGVEIIRDTVYVTYNAFTVNLPNMSTKSYFDTPVTVTTDYIVSVFTPTDDSLFILANDPFTNAGNGENLGHALYDNASYPSFTGWYSMVTDFGYDYDFLIAPLVKYDLHEGFDVINDTICPGITANGCVENYNQVAIFGSGHYNSNSANSTSSIRWLWGDGTFNTNLTQPLCHTYQNSGTYDLNLQDTMYRWDYNTAYCLVNVSQDIVALDTVIANFNFIQTNVEVDFTSTSSFNDSVWWDFGNDTIGGNLNSITHNYDSIGTFDVWLHVYNDCTEDSIMFQVTTDDVGIEEANYMVKIYPNPSSTSVTMENIPSNSIIEVYNIVGERVIITQAISNSTSINVSELCNGTYFIKINSDLKSFTKMLVVKH